jgi:hypothetical protein
MIVYNTTNILKKQMGFNGPNADTSNNGKGLKDLGP